MVVFSFVNFASMKLIDPQIRWKKFILITGLIWLLQGTYSTLNTGVFQQYNQADVMWLAISIYSYGTAIVWWMLMPIMLWTILKLKNYTTSIYKLIGIHLILAIGVSAIQRLLNIAISYNLIKWTEAVNLSLLKLENFFGSNFVRNVGNGLLVYFVVVAILYGYLYYLDHQAQKINQSLLSAELSKVKLENLKYQMQPHFLFNSLQSISTLIHRDTKAADQALGDLGDLLRYSIRNIDTETVSLGEEIMSIQKYIDLQKTRYGENLNAQIDFEDGLMETRVPAFLLQPIIENSIKHNIEHSGNPVHIYVTISKEDEMISIQVKDDGVSEKEHATKKGNGLGLHNLKLRLETLYQNRAVFEASKLSPIGFRTIIKIPLV
jgi:sensor histidine kinase YesM